MVGGVYLVVLRVGGGVGLGVVVEGNVYLVVGALVVEGGK